MSVGYVAKQLKDAGIIKYKGLFELYCSVSHAKTKIDPGTYELSTNYDYRALVKKMQVAPAPWSRPRSPSRGLYDGADLPQARG